MVRICTPIINYWLYGGYLLFSTPVAQIAAGLLCDERVLICDKCDVEKERSEPEVVRKRVFSVDCSLWCTGGRYSVFWGADRDSYHSS